MKYRSKEEFDQANMFGTGPANTVCFEHISGQSYMNLLATPEQTPAFVANLTFEPGCRNNWHVHHADEGGGHILLCTAGEGWYQEEGKPAVALSEGSAVVVPIGVKHWHGARADSWFSHIVVDLPGVNKDNEWLEPVSDQEYQAL